MAQPNLHLLVFRVNCISVGNPRDQMILGTLGTQSVKYAENQGLFGGVRAILIWSDSFGECFAFNQGYWDNVQEF